jgi:hypothetical protein
MEILSLDTTGLVPHLQSFHQCLCPKSAGLCSRRVGDRERRVLHSFEHITVEFLRAFRQTIDGAADKSFGEPICSYEQRNRTLLRYYQTIGQVVPKDCLPPRQCYRRVRFPRATGPAQGPRCIRTKPRPGVLGKQARHQRRNILNSHEPNWNRNPSARGS